MICKSKLNQNAFFVLNSQQFIIDFHENGKKNQNNSLYWKLILHFCFMRSKSKKGHIKWGGIGRKKNEIKCELIYELGFSFSQHKKISMK